MEVDRLFERLERRFGKGVVSFNPSLRKFNILANFPDGVWLTAEEAEFLLDHSISAADIAAKKFPDDWPGER